MFINMISTNFIESKLFNRHHQYTGTESMDNYNFNTRTLFLRVLDYV